MASEIITEATSKLEEELKMRTKAEEKLTKLGYLLEIAQSRDIIVTCARSNYVSSQDKLYKDKDAIESIKKTDEGLFQLTKALMKESLDFSVFRNGPIYPLS